MIRILLVDDDPLCREGLRQILSLAPDLLVVGEASSPDEACELGPKVQPDVVIVDADLPRASCLETMARLAGAEDRAEQCPSFICLALYPDQHDAAIRAGAARFLPKDSSRLELFEAVRSTVRARPPGVEGVRLGPPQRVAEPGS